MEVGTFDELLLGEGPVRVDVDSCENVPGAGGGVAGRTVAHPLQHLVQRLEGGSSKNDRHKMLQE